MDRIARGFKNFCSLLGQLLLLFGLDNAAFPRVYVYVEVLARIRGIVPALVFKRLRLALDANFLIQLVDALLVLISLVLVVSSFATTTGAYITFFG